MTHLGFKMLEATKRKISIGVKKNPPRTTFKKGQKAWNKGIKKTLNTGRTHIKKGEKIAWKGGRFMAQGYVMLYRPFHPMCNSDGYIQEHRLIYEINTGKRLTRIEIIHHINGIKDDNRFENLLKFPNLSKHVKHHAKKRKELL